MKPNLAFVIAFKPPLTSNCLPAKKDVNSYRKTYLAMACCIILGLSGCELAFGRYGQSWEKQD